MKKLSILALATAFTASAMAATAADGEQVLQKAMLKNGSVLYGYVQQNDGRGNLVFHTDSAVIYLDNVEVDVVDRTVSYATLTPLWQKWAKANNALTGPSSSQYMVMNDLTVRATHDSLSTFMRFMKTKSFVPNVKLLERGVRHKYVELSASSYRVSWNDVESITSERRPKTALSGIDRIYQTKNGQSYEGQYAGESSTTTSLFLPSGVKQTLKKSEVVKYIFKPVNTNQTIFEQSRLLDVVSTVKNGSNTGVIIEQNYASNKDADNYILLQQESGTIQSIRISDIIEISKKQNPKYAPEYDVVVPADSMYINRNMSKVTTITSKKGVNTLQEFQPVSLRHGSNNLTYVTVEYKATMGANVEAYRLVALTAQKKSKGTFYSFTDGDLANSTYRPISIKTTVNETTKAVYQINGTGSFILYNAKNKMCYPFVVK